MITWIIGEGGLLGSALAGQSSYRYQPTAVPWSRPEKAARVLHQQARDFEGTAQRGPWRVIWAAGAATTSTSAEEAASELHPLEGLLTGLRSALPPGPGCFFLASSAGGVYAGSDHPPFGTDTQPVPLSPYGELKIAQEKLTSQTLGNVVPVVLGRISNLYGPGQNLDKLQGLISRLALAAVTRTPINIFVPLDTIRDYIFAADAAEVILGATETALGRVPSTTTEIIASGRGITVGQLIRTMNEIAKRRVPVALGTHASGAAQAVDLRVIPTLTPAAPTTLPSGVKATYQDILERAQDHVLISAR